MDTTRFAIRADFDAVDTDHESRRLHHDQRFRDVEVGQGTDVACGACLCRVGRAPLKVGVPQK